MKCLRSPTKKNLPCTRTGPTRSSSSVGIVRGGAATLSVSTTVIREAPGIRAVAAGPRNGRRSHNGRKRSSLGRLASVPGQRRADYSFEIRYVSTPAEQLRRKGGVGH